jgi:Acetyltransferase (GNAT) domain
MTRPELDVAVEWAADEGWNPGLKDADCFHRTDSDGFLMGFRDGEPVASISVVRYDGAFGFLVQGGPIFLDVPEPNRAAVKLGGRYGFRPVFETARMYRGPEPSLPLDRIYGIKTFELG